MGAWRGRVGSRTPSHGPFTPGLLSTEGFQSWMWRGLTFLLPFLFCGHVSPRGVCVYPLLWADPWERKVLRRLPQSPANPELGPVGSREAKGKGYSGLGDPGFTEGGLSVSQGSWYQKAGDPGLPTKVPGECWGEQCPLPPSSGSSTMQ